jgi:hypothetical protein
MPTSLPREYLELSLHDLLVLALEHDAASERTVPLDTITRALERFANSIAARDNARTAEQREWLARMPEELAPE